MIETAQILNDEELNLLRQLRGATWTNISSRGMHDADLAWTDVRIETSNASVLISLVMEDIDISGGVDEYPSLHVVQSPALHPDAIKHGRIYYQTRGETVREIWVLRETLTCEVNEEIDFRNVADVLVSFQLDTQNISFARTAHFSDVFAVQYVPTHEDIELPDTLSEWEEDLMNHYELTREWIKVA